MVRQDQRVRYSTAPAVAKGSMATTTQPSWTIDHQLELRPWAADDAPVLIAAFADPAIAQWHFLRIDTTDEAVEWVDRTHQLWSEESSANWAVVDRETGHVRGRVGLTSVHLGFGVGEIAYWVLPEARSRGVAYRAAAAVAGWTFATLGLHRLEIGHSVHNPASCRVATAAGFALEGTRRSSLLHVDGWHDMHLHARIASDPGPRHGTDLPDG